MRLREQPRLLDRRPLGESRVGAVITFKPGVSPIQAQKALEAMAVAGFIDDTVAHEYDTYYGGPVWYIP